MPLCIVLFLNTEECALLLLVTLHFYNCLTIMSLSQVIRDVISLPERFHSQGNLSSYTLLQESGYFALHDKISETEIYEEISRHSEYINAWLSWSENKRSETGWFFRQNELGVYLVGWYGPLGIISEISYVDKIQACSVFIKHEIEEIRTL